MNGVKPPVVIAMGALLLFVAFAQKNPCTFNDWNQTPYWQYENYCYSDILPLWYSYGLEHDRLLYIEQPLEYPVLSGGLMQVAAWGTDDLQSYMLLTFAILLGFGLLATVAMARTAREPWRVFAWSLSPAVVVHGFTNWDLMPVGLAALGWWAWTRRRPFESALLFGLGGAAKLYPVLFLPPLFIDRLIRRDWKGAGLTLAGGTLGFAGPNGYVAARNWENWEFIWRFHGRRPPDFETIWESHLKEMFWHGSDTGWRELVEMIGAVVMLATLALLVFSQWRNGSDPLWAGGVLVLVFLLVNKVYSPQYTLWAVPVLVMLGRGVWLYWVPYVAYTLADLSVFLVRYRLFIPPEGQTSGWNEAWNDDSKLSVLLRWIFLAWLTLGIVAQGYRAQPQIEPASTQPPPAPVAFQPPMARDA